MKNAASCETWCELQDTLSTDFSNAHCGFGLLPGATPVRGSVYVCRRDLAFLSGRVYSTERSRPKSWGVSECHPLVDLSLFPGILDPRLTGAPVDSVALRLPRKGVPGGVAPPGHSVRGVVKARSVKGTTVRTRRVTETLVLDVRVNVGSRRETADDLCRPRIGRDDPLDLSI